MSRYNKQGLRRCSRCKEYKGSTHYYEGSTGYCIICQAAYAAEYRATHKKPKKSRPIVDKPSLTKEERRIKSLEYGFIPRGSQSSRCNKCKRLRAVEVMFDGVCAVCSRHQKNHTSKRGRPRKYHAYTTKGRLRLSKLAYKQTEAYKHNKAVARHKRRSRMQGSSFTAKELRQLYAQYNHTCLACGCTDCQLTPDHVKPLALGGSNDIENIQPLCFMCNSKKGAKEIDYR